MRNGRTLYVRVSPHAKGARASQGELRFDATTLKSLPGYKEMSTTIRFGYVLFTGNNRQSTNGLSNCLLRASSAGAPVKDNPVQCESRHWTARCTGNRTASRTAALGLLLRCERPVQAGQRLCSGAEVLRVHHSVASNLLNRLHYQAGTLFMIVICYIL